MCYCTHVSLKTAQLRCVDGLVQLSAKLRLRGQPCPVDVAVLLIDNIVAFLADRSSIFHGWIRMDQGERGSWGRNGFRQQESCLERSLAHGDNHEPIECASWINHINMPILVVVCHLAIVAIYSPNPIKLH